MNTLFHPETLSTIQHPECSCCNKDMQNQPAGICSVYVSTKDRRTHERLYFPYLHFVCDVCYPIVCDMVEQLERRDPCDFLKNPRLRQAMDFLARSPSWSLMQNKFVHSPWYRFHHMSLQQHSLYIAPELLKVMMLVCVKENISDHICNKMIGFAGENRLQMFAETVNLNVDVDFWDTYIFANEANEDDDVFAEEETE